MALTQQARIVNPRSPTLKLARIGHSPLCFGHLKQHLIRDSSMAHRIHNSKFAEQFEHLRSLLPKRVSQLSSPAMAMFTFSYFPYSGWLLALYGSPCHSMNQHCGTGPWIIRRDLSTCGRIRDEDRDIRWHSSESCFHLSSSNQLLVST